MQKRQWWLEMETKEDHEHDVQKREISTKAYRVHEG
jgi:hypothetical protein